MIHRLWILFFAFAGTGALAAAGEGPSGAGATAALEEALRGLDAGVLSGREAELPRMLEAHAQREIEDANRRETAAFRQVKGREDWERFRDARRSRLRESLGTLPPRPPREVKVRVTRVLPGDGYRIEDLVFESRPGLWVTANLYAPDPPPAKPLPGILICHSHHQPKEEGELQDLGASFARAGCLVLVMDQLGHGERRQHAFLDPRSYPRPFRAGRQDYYFRYTAGMQLHLAGESLLGWMVGDLIRGVDLLLARPGVDGGRILLLGSVAGGGEPAAVAAALDDRIAAVVPFNFGGPQPETPYPLPEDAEETFGYVGGGSWESTRNLRLSARDGFLPWTIVGSVAPRGLVYAHEFSWDRERDPVWRRLEAIYGFYGARDHLAFTHGRGLLSGSPPQATHCNNIGPEHLPLIHAAFRSWFGIEPPPAGRTERRSAGELRCLSEEARANLRPQPLHDLLEEMVRGRAEEARRSLTVNQTPGLPPEARRAEVSLRWGRILGEFQAADQRVLDRRSEPFAGGVLERAALETERGIVVPLLLFLPREAEERAPVVVAFAQEGKRALLEARRRSAASLLAGGAALCLPDLRGTGETRPRGDDRGRRSSSTGISSTYLMLGRTLLGSRQADLRAVLAFLRRHPGIDGSRLALWGDSLAPANAPGQDLEAPLDAEPFPGPAEPLGAILAVLTALSENGVTAVYARGGLQSYRSLLVSSSVHVPHDAIVPGAIGTGDLPAAAAALPPGTALLEGEVDGLNRAAPGAAVPDEDRAARWVLSRLKK